MCLACCPHGGICTRPPAHAGLHQARDEDDVLTCQWEEAESVSRAEADAFLAGVAGALCGVAVFMMAGDVLGRSWPAAIITCGLAVSLGLLARYWIRRGFDPPALRIVLDTADFGRLVRGQWVGRPGARIVLADIGFAAMARELRDAAAAVPYAGGETEEWTF